MKRPKPRVTTEQRMHVHIVATGHSTISNIRIGNEAIVASQHERLPPLVTTGNKERDHRINYVLSAIFIPLILILISALVHKYLLRKTEIHVLQDESSAARDQQGNEPLWSHRKGEGRWSTHEDGPI